MMTRTELNQFLKSLGYGNMKFKSSDSTKPGSCLKSGSVFIKGIKMADVGPLTITEPQNAAFDKFLSNFTSEVGWSVAPKSHGGRVCEVHGHGMVLQFALCSYRSYNDSESDPAYRTHFVKFTHRK